MILLFCLSFAIVHLFKLAYVGFLSIKKLPEPPEKEDEKPKKEKQPEPVYYIVEKKRARKSTYSEPKEIQFKK
ncbi:MAG: hypothetical protein E7370_05730 [Clostridiales bacterium]|nr:hypothetical protein [Clostridiales bacterium]